MKPVKPCKPTPAAAKHDSARRLVARPRPKTVPYRVLAVNADGGHSVNIVLAATRHPWEAEDAVKEHARRIGREAASRTFIMGFCMDADPKAGMPIVTCSGALVRINLAPCHGGMRREDVAHVLALIRKSLRREGMDWVEVEG